MRSFYFFRSTSSQTHQEQNENQTPFFQQQNQSGFFNETQSAPTNFFSNQPVQTKPSALTVGRPGDRYEVEADRMADQVVKGINTPSPVTAPVLQTKCAACEKEELQKKEQPLVDSVTKIQRKPIFESESEGDLGTLQRKCAHCEEESEKVQGKSGESASVGPSNLSQQLNHSKGQGSPLSEGTRSQMEQSFGAKFANVRIHTDSPSVAMNQNLHAQAFTHGSDIYFNEGKYDDNTEEGQHLLAHELTHVVQQAGNLSKANQIQRSSNPLPTAKISITRTGDGPVKTKKDAKFHLNIEQPPKTGYYHFRWSLRDDDNKAYYMRSLDDDSIVQYFGSSKNAYINTPSLQLLYQRNGKKCKVLCRVMWSESSSPPKRKHFTPEDSRLMQIRFSFEPRHEDYEQNTRELKNRYWKDLRKGQFTKALKSQATELDSDIKHTKQIIALSRMAMFNRAVEQSPDITSDFRSSWMSASLAVETANTMISKNEFPDFSQNQARTAFIRFFHAFIKFQEEEERQAKVFEETWNLQPTTPKFQDVCKTNKCHTTVEPTFRRKLFKAPLPYSPTLKGYFKSATSASGATGWSNIIRDFQVSTGKLDSVLNNKLGGRSKEMEQLNYSKGLLKRQRKLQEEQPFAIRIPAVFYPKDDIIDVKDKDGNSSKKAKEIPWLFYLHHTGFKGYDRPAVSGGEWVLQDMTSPKKIKRNLKASSDIDAAMLQQGAKVNPPTELFEQLNSALRFPKGMLYWKMPNGKDWELETTEPLSLSQFLGYVGIGLAALGVILFTAGAGTPAAAALIGSAALGVGSTLAGMHEKSQHDMLTQEDIHKAALFIAADIASALTLGMGRVLTVAAQAGRLTRFTAMVGRSYATVKKASAVLDIGSFIVVTDEFVNQFQAIKTQPGLSKAERDAALTRLVTTGILTGAVMTPSVVGGLKDLKPGRTPLHLKVNPGGDLVPNIDMSSKTTLPKADKEFLKMMEDLPNSKINSEMLMREFEIAQKSPFKFPGASGSKYVQEIPIGKHSWKKSIDGRWCRFSNDPLCIIIGQSLIPSPIKVWENVSVPYKGSMSRGRVVDVTEDAVKIQFKSKSKKGGEITQTMPRSEFDRLLADKKIIRWSAKREALMRSRPSYEKGLVNKVWNKAKDAKGKVYDPHTKQELTWDQTKTRENQWHMGHKPGEEYVKLVDQYVNGHISWDEFLRRYNDSSKYWPELPSENLSHKHEQK